MDKDTLHGFNEFGESPDLLKSSENRVTRFIALGYAKGSDALPLASWKHFTKKMVEGEKAATHSKCF